MVSDLVARTPAGIARRFGLDVDAVRRHARKREPVDRIGRTPILSEEDARAIVDELRQSQQAASPARVR